jgi:hypothetical protein
MYSYRRVALKEYCKISLLSVHSVELGILLRDFDELSIDLFGRTVAYNGRIYTSIYATVLRVETAFLHGKYKKYFLLYLLLVNNIINHLLAF